MKITLNTLMVTVAAVAMSIVAVVLVVKMVVLPNINEKKSGVSSVSSSVVSYCPLYDSDNFEFQYYT